jgi:hypothetical protein
MWSDLLEGRAEKDSQRLLALMNDVRMRATSRHQQRELWLPSGRKAQRCRGGSIGAGDASQKPEHRGDQPPLSGPGGMLV